MVAFPGPCMVGSIAANYIIEQLRMHQIAFVDSEFIIPGIIYIGGKLRHPFRIYADNDGKICIILCDIPIIRTGIHSVLSTVVKWIKKYNPKEVILLDGFPVEGIPGPDRKTLALSSDVKAAYNDGGLQPIGDDDDSDSKFMAFVEGTSGGFLASCLSDEIRCTGLYIPASNGIPDSEGAALLIESIGSLRHGILDINTSPLRRKGEKTRRQMEDLIKVMLAQQQKQQEQGQPNARVERMYT
ncbi:MAG: PAC2 family protein [Nitrososphaeraceae archaeon]